MFGMLLHSFDFLKKCILSILAICFIPNDIDLNGIREEILIIPVVVNIELVDVEIEILNSLGDEWTHYSVINYDTLSIGERTTVRKTINTPILIESTSIEHDKYDDIGTDVFELSNFNNDCFSTTVQVQENNPNQYTRGDAFITFIYKVGVD